MKRTFESHNRFLGPADVSTMRRMLDLFSEAFDDPAHYRGNPPADSYLRTVLASDQLIAIAATVDDEVIGGLVAYHLRKFEQERSEIYIYDLAVAVAHRRRGLATTLIEMLRREALTFGAYAIYVQADVDDAPAVALYSKLGTRADVLHFDIVPRGLNRDRGP